MLTEFLIRTAWPMVKPPSYGAFHLIFFFGGLAVCLLLAYLLRNCSEKTHRAVMLSVGIFLFVCELYKQLFYTVVIGGGQYQWWIFPFQLCSIPMYFCIIAPFLKPGRVKTWMYEFMLAFNLMGGFVAFLEPSGLVHEYWTLTLHAFIWHLALIFIGLHIGFSRRAGRDLKSYGGTVGCFAVLCIVAFVINLCLYDISGGSVNMFYVGPVNSPIIVFKDIAATYGWYVNTPIYMLALCIAAFIFYLPFCLYNRRRKKKEALEIQ